MLFFYSIFCTVAMKRGILYFLKYIWYRYPPPPIWGRGSTQYYFRQVHKEYIFNTQCNCLYFRLLVWSLKALSLKFFLYVFVQGLYLLFLVIDYSLVYIISNWYSDGACTLGVGSKPPPGHMSPAFFWCTYCHMLLVNKWTQSMWLYNCVLLTVHICLGI